MTNTDRPFHLSIKESDVQLGSCNGENVKLGLEQVV